MQINWKKIWDEYDEWCYHNFKHEDEVEDCEWHDKIQELVEEQLKCRKE